MAASNRLGAGQQMTASPTLIGIGSGLVAAVLFASLANNTALAVTLFYLTPLPLLLAGVGWGARAALLSCVTALVLVGIFLGGVTALVFGLCIGVPGAVLSYLMLLRRQVTPPAAPGANPPPIVQWYPLGSIIAWSALMAGGIVAIALILFVAIGGDMTAYRHGVRAIFDEGGLARLQALLGPGFGPAELDRLVERIARLFLPAIVVSFWMLVMLANLWLATKAAVISGLLDRPAPDVTTADYPPLLAAGFFAAIGIGFVPGLIGVAGVAFAGAFGFAFVILGMGVVHVLLARTAMKPLFLFFIYLGLFATPWIAPIIAAVGLAEPFIQLRQRSTQQPTPPGSGAGPNR
jgi:Predicted membrane protein (DUF2232)